VRDKVPISYVGVRAAQLNRWVHRVTHRAWPKVRRILLVLASTAGLVDCASRPMLQSVPQLTSERVLSIAQSALAKCAPAGSSYKPDKPGYVPNGKEWWVFFHKGEESIDPHSGMVVVVNDRTERACVHRASEPGVVGRCT
jgi:hypothetical protein